MLQKLFSAKVSRSSKSEWNTDLSMQPHFFMTLENLIIDISLIFICNVTKIVLCCSQKLLLFRDDCDLKNISIFLFV